MPLHIGALLADRYRITRVLGQGGMGAVYLATDESLGQPCAVKENLKLSPDSERLFRREATLLATLRHRHLPRVTNHFVLENEQYLVMDYVEGEDLGQRLERQGPLPERLVGQWAEQLCDALGYLHSLNPPVIHRDIKPANIKLTPSGEIMLVDFGVARPTSPGDPQGRETATNTLAFTPGFTPPEQYGLGRTDARADQYALAATLYTLLTAQPPPDSVERLLGNVGLIPPDTLRPGLAPGLVAALTRALAVQPEDRFPTVAAFRVALSAALTTPTELPTGGLRLGQADATMIAGPAAPAGPPLTMMGTPSADATIVRPRPADPTVPPGATLPLPAVPSPAGPPPTMFERPAAPPANQPPTLFERPGASPADLPTGPVAPIRPAGPAPTLFEPGGRPPAPPPPTRPMAYTAPLPAPPPTGAAPVPAPQRARPRWLLPAALGCGFVVLAVAALAGGSALGNYLSGTATLAATAAPPTVTVPAVAAVTETEPAPTAAPTQIGQALDASATPEFITTEAAPPADTETPEPATDTPAAPSETAAPAGTPIGSGGRLAFISNRDGLFFQVYTMNADGSDVQQVTTDPTDKWSANWPYNGTQLAWSPDGRQLLYVANGEGNNVLDLWVIDADGANPQNLTHAAGDDFQPSWCSDGTIWFASNRINGNRQIFGTTLADLLGGVRPFNFSGTHNNPIEFDPAPYPDCQRLMFTSTLDGPNEIWRYWPDCPECYRKVRTLKDLGGRAEEPAVSPDGLWLAYTRVLPDATEIILASAEDRTTNNQLTSSLNNHSPQWSPDGQWIAFVSERDGNREVYVMTPTGAQQTNLSQNPAHDTDPVWQPRAP